MMGTPAREAASRPKIPALPLWVWTIWGWVDRKIRVRRSNVAQS